MELLDGEACEASLAIAVTVCIGVAVPRGGSEDVDGGMVLEVVLNEVDTEVELDVDSEVLEDRAWA